MDSIRTDTRCRKVGLWSGGGAQKGGVVKAAHTRIPLTCECTPRVASLQFVWVFRVPNIELVYLAPFFCSPTVHTFLVLVLFLSPFFIA